MRREQQFLAGALAGAAAVLAGRRAIRQHYAIDLAGRGVLITGGSRGLGLVLGRQFVRAGARVALIARDGSELERARAQLLELGAEDAPAFVCDVRSREDVDRVISELLARWREIDILINNAGVIEVGPLEHMTHDDFEDALATHFWGPLYTMQACLPAMRRRGFGRIANISSIGGRLAVPHLLPYCASKFALTGLSDGMRAELAADGIRITSVFPGLMRTGSPINVDTKGRHAAEFSWFALADSMPILTMSAERAAARIVDAVQHGVPELVLGWPARLGILASALAPHVLARAAAVAARLLPNPNGREGDVSVKGRNTGATLAPSPLTVLTNRAAARNNEL
jgi:NAD(P)-dependent dehydrogenase (short-subunit alcohol dehydrogenase family)